MAPSYHARSSSFPSRSHPITSEVDQHLSRFRASQATSTSLSAISHEINSLQDLYDFVNKLFELASIQQALAQDKQKKWVDELLNGSLRLLDICGIAEDSLLQTKEAVQGLQSIFRRRKCDDTEVTSEVKKYLTSRKTVKKTIQKTFKNLNQRTSPISEEHETSVMLREVEAVTFNVIESLFSLILGPRAPSKLSTWSLVSKLMKPTTCKETDINEFEKVDAELSSIIAHKTSKSDNIQNQLKELESNIQNLEEGIESLNRRLIKIRVSLLNILNN